MGRNGNSVQHTVLLTLVLAAAFAAVGCGDDGAADGTITDVRLQSQAALPGDLKSPEEATQEELEELLEPLQNPGWSGYQALDQPCIEDFHCQSSLKCHRTFGDRFSKCVLPASEGELCDLDFPCAAGLQCSYNDEFDVQACTATSEMGEPCTWDWDCDPGLECYWPERGRDENGLQSFCTEPAGLGQNCYDRPCMAGLECYDGYWGDFCETDFDYYSGRKYADYAGDPRYAGLSDLCENGETCAPGLKCYRPFYSPLSRCVMPAQANEPCSDYFPCADGLKCEFNNWQNTRTCRAPALPGQGCAVDSDCVYNHKCRTTNTWYGTHDVCMPTAGLGQGCLYLPCGEGLTCDFDPWYGTVCFPGRH